MRKSAVHDRYWLNIYPESSSVHQFVNDDTNVDTSASLYRPEFRKIAYVSINHALHLLQIVTIQKIIRNKRNKEIREKNNVIQTM